MHNDILRHYSPDREVLNLEELEKECMGELTEPEQLVDKVKELVLSRH